MCLSNAVKTAPPLFCGPSAVETELTKQIEQLQWESEIREAELDRVIESEKRYKRLERRIRRITQLASIAAGDKIMLINHELTSHSDVPENSQTISNPDW